MATKLRIALVGFDNREITSIVRTAAFYVEAYESLHDVTHVTAPGRDFDWGGFDLVADFMHHFIEADWRPDLPIVYCLHGTAARGMLPYRRHGHKLRRGDRFIVGCTSDKAIIEDIYYCGGPPASVLPLPVEERTFFPLPKSECKARLGLEGAAVLGFVGRLYPQKNLHRFLLMAADIRRRLKGRPLKCVVVGEYCTYPYFDWYSERRYEEYIEGLVRSLNLEQDVMLLHSCLPDQPLNDYYNAFDLLLHPTNVLDENFGYVPVEVMSCGVPVVANGWGGLKDTVLSGVNGLLLPTWLTQTGLRSSYQLGVEYAVGLLEDEAALGALSAGCRQRAKAFSFERFTVTLDRIVRDVAGRHRAGGDCPPDDGPVVYRRLGWEAELPFPRHAEARLPPFMDDWYDVAPFSARYASAPMPVVGALDRPLPAGPLVENEDGSLGLDDPCWPASFDLSARERELLARCDGERSVKTVSAEAGLAAAEGVRVFQKLCELGLITV
ncbi:MAG TPA: glycosyltransferase [Pyrinomonadaceae bacterium]